METVKLGEIATVWDCLHKTPSYSDDGFPMVRVTDIKQGFLNLSETKKVDEATYDEFNKRHKPRIGDSLLSRVGSYGNSTFIDKAEEFCIGQNTVCITPDCTKIAPFYLYACLNSPSLKNQMNALVGGASQPTLSLKNINLLELPYPSLNDQKRIADELYAYEKLTSINLRRIQILEEMAQNLYREWFVIFRFPGHQHVKMIDSPLGRIPAGWEIIHLRELVQNVKDSTYAGDHLSERSYIPIDCIPRKSICITDMISWQEAQSSLILFNENDILFGAMRPYFHKVAIAPCEGVTRMTCFVLRPHNLDFHAYSLYLLFQDETVAFANSHSRGSTIPYAVWDGSLSEYKFACPPIAIAKKYQTLIHPILSEIKNMARRVSVLQKQRDMLLPHLLDHI